jgi:threonine synthase
LADFFATGVYDRRRELVKTESPSMDISFPATSSGFCTWPPAAMETGGFAHATVGRGCGFEISEAEQHYMKDFAAGWCSDAAAGP